MAMAMMEAAADWCNLPKDILEAISKKISCVEDYLRFRAVCIPWRSAVSPAPRHLPPHFPLLMLPYQFDPHLNQQSPIRFFYDISNSQIRPFYLPETCGKQCSGSSQGWLLLENGPLISLFNPITRVQIQLPSLKVFPTIWSASTAQSGDIQSRLDIWPSRYGYNGATEPITQRIILTSSPTLDPDCVVMVLFKSNWGLAFCRIGDESWTLFEAPAQNGTGFRLIDATYNNGLFYCFSFDEVKVYDLKGPMCKVLKIIIPLEQADYHLIEGQVEELMLVAQHRAAHGLSRRDEFSIYKIGMDEERLDWIETRGIGERMCFICEGIEQCFTFPVDNLKMLPVVGGNLLCYCHPLIVEKNREDFWGWHPEDKFGYDIKMVKLPNQRVPCFSNYWKENVIQLVKDFGSYPTGYTRALWITPSFY